MTDQSKLKEILKAAETQIIHLQGEMKSHDEYVEAQRKQQETAAEETARLTAKVAELENMLGDVAAERDDVRELLEGLREDMEKIRDVAAQTLKATTDKQSLVTMAAKFYDVKTLADSAAFLKD